MPKSDDKRPTGSRVPETASKGQKVINEGQSKFSREPIITSGTSKPIVPTPRKNKNSGVK